MHVHELFDLKGRAAIVTGGSRGRGFREWKKPGAMGGGVAAVLENLR